MEQLFIRVKKENGDFINKDIKDTNYNERVAWYQTLSKGQVIHVLEQFVSNKMMEANRI